MAPPNAPTPGKQRGGELMAYATLSLISAFCAIPFFWVLLASVDGNASLFLQWPRELTIDSSSPACAALLIDMVVATLTQALSTLPKVLSPLDWLDDLLYLPEVLYVLFFIWLICSGPGKFSVDYWLAGKLPQ